MAWCHQTPSHYLSQRWPKSLSRHGITRPQCFKWFHRNGKCVKMKINDKKKSRMCGSIWVRWNNMHWCHYIFCHKHLDLQLTHWGRDKMAAISQTTFWNAFSWMKLWISLKISLKFVPKGPINNIPTLVQVMAWFRPGDNWQAIIWTNGGRLTDAYLHCSASLG